MQKIVVKKCSHNGCGKVCGRCSKYCPKCGHNTFGDVYIVRICPSFKRFLSVLFDFPGTSWREDLKTPGDWIILTFHVTAILFVLVGIPLLLHPYIN